MNAKDALKKTLKSTQGMLEMYLSDLSDADLLVRPVPGANHAAWPRWCRRLRHYACRFGERIATRDAPGIQQHRGQRHAMQGMGAVGAENR